jgi:hypothetical protein
MGQQGPDVILRGEALRRFPFSVECSNTEKWNVHSKIAQAKANTPPDLNWIVIFKKNRGKPVAVMDAETLIAILGDLK